MTAPSELFALGIDGSRSVYVRNADGSWPTVPTRIERPATSQEGERMPTLWEDPAGKGYPCFERPMTPNEARETIDRLSAQIVAYENAATPTPPTLSEDLREAAQAVIEQAFDFYKARNGRVMSIEGEDGEKCWIVPFDAFEQLRAALAQVKAS